MSEGSGVVITGVELPIIDKHCLQPMTQNAMPDYILMATRLDRLPGRALLGKSDIIGKRSNLYK